MKLVELLTESITRTVYRARPEFDVSRYPGEYWTEIRELADRYAQKRKGDSPREVITSTLSFEPNEVLNVSSLSPQVRQQLASEFVGWFEKNYPGEDIEGNRGPYLYEVLVNGETDFVYPTEVDHQFLKLKGIKAVYYEREGGEVVKTWYVLN